MKRTLTLVTACGLALACQAALAKPRAEQATVWLKAGVEISTEGKITALEWTATREIEKAIAARIEPAVRAWQFEPGRIDGVPQPTTTHLKIKIRAEQNNDSVALFIDDASTGAMSSMLAPPVYPESAMRASADAVVVAEVAVAEDGQATVEKIDFRGNRPAYRKQFVQATEAAIANWSFVPERVGGRPLATRMRVPVTFCTTTLDCAHKYPVRDAAHTPAPLGPPDQPVALESAVRLVDAVAGRAL